jgi:hypothetical protein
MENERKMELSLVQSEQGTEKCHIRVTREEESQKKRKDNTFTGLQKGQIKSECMSCSQRKSSTFQGI